MGKRKTAQATAKGQKRKKAAARRAAVRQAAGMAPVVKLAARVVMLQESQYAIGQSTNTKAGRSKANLLFVVYEALRLAGYTDHILANGFEPKDPVFFDLGFSEEEIAEGCSRGIRSVEEGRAYYKWLTREASKQRETHVKADGSVTHPKQRNTTTILGTALASWPGDPKEEMDKPEFKLWVQLTIAFARKQYGKALKAAILHVDEGALHLHLWCDNGGRNVKPLQAGQKAAAATLAAGGTSEQAGEAVRAANEAMLDDYHREVGQHVRLARRSESPKPSLKRRERLEEQAEEIVAEAKEVVRKANNLHAGRKRQHQNTLENMHLLRTARQRARALLSAELFDKLYGKSAKAEAQDELEEMKPKVVKAVKARRAVPAPAPEPEEAQMVVLAPINKADPMIAFKSAGPDWLKEKLNNAQLRKPNVPQPKPQPEPGDHPAPGG